MNACPSALSDDRGSSAIHISDLAIQVREDEEVQLMQAIEQADSWSLWFQSLCAWYRETTKRNLRETQRWQVSRTTSLPPVLGTDLVGV